MKTLKRSFFWAICIALVAAFSACNLNPCDPDPEPDPKPVAKDTVAIEVTLNAPAGAVLGNIILTLWSDSIPNGFSSQYVRSDVRSFRFVFYDEVARALIGTECELYSALDGSMNGIVRDFYPVGRVHSKLTLKKGINQITIEITYW